MASCAVSGAGALVLGSTGCLEPVLMELQCHLPAYIVLPQKEPGLGRILWEMSLSRESQVDQKAGMSGEISGMMLVSHRAAEQCMVSTRDSEHT